jgi:hypothetical protein
MTLHKLQGFQHDHAPGDYDAVYIDVQDELNLR